MPHGSVFITNKTQAVRLPIETSFDKSLKEASIRTVGKDRILSPVENIWDSFFLADQNVTDDFLNEIAEQTESVRKEF